MRRRREESKTMRSRRKKWRRETCKEERLIERRYGKEGERIAGWFWWKYRGCLWRKRRKGTRKKKEYNLHERKRRRERE